MVLPTAQVKKGQLGFQPLQMPHFLA